VSACKERENRVKARRRYGSCRFRRAARGRARRAYYGKVVSAHADIRVATAYAPADGQKAEGSAKHQPSSSRPDDQRAANAYACVSCGA